MENVSKTNSQAIYNILSQIILNGTNFILIMLFTRYLTTDNYGIVSIYQAYVLFFAILVGLNVQGSIGPAFVHIDKTQRNNYLASVFLLALLSFFIFIAIIFVFLKPLSNFAQLTPALLILMVAHSFGVFCFNFASIKYVYLRKSQYSCLLAILLAVSMIVFSWLGIIGSKSFLPQYTARILGLSIPYIICAIYVTTTIFIKGNPFMNIKGFWNFCLPICLPLIFHGISQVILSQTDKIMLQKILADNSAVGLYSFIVTFVHILNSIYIALNNTWVPLYYEYTKERQISLILRRAKRYNNLFTILVVGFMLVSPEVVMIFADPAYWNGIYIIPLVVLSIYFMFLYSFAVNFEIYHKKTKLIAVGTTAAAVANIILNTMFIPYFGIFGAAMATLISYFLLFIFHEISARTIKNEKYPFKQSFFIKNILIVFLFSILFSIFRNNWEIRWILAIVVGFYLIFDIYKNKTLF